MFTKEYVWEQHFLYNTGAIYLYYVMFTVLNKDILHSNMQCFAWHYVDKENSAERTLILIEFEWHEEQKSMLIIINT
jgi:hypothetical protein